VTQAPIRWFAGSLLLSGLMLGACHDSRAGFAEASQPATAAGAERSAPARRAVSPSTSLSKSDRILLEMADNACKAKAYQSLFDAIARSDTVRQKYSADKIEYVILSSQGNAVSRQLYTKANYRKFPVKLVDYSYKPAAPLWPGDVGEYLDIQITQSQNNEVLVEWAHVHYVGEPVDDDRGQRVDSNGKRVENGTHPVAEGQLIFRPTADCWQLSKDRRWMRTKW
jgi:hypothetical protein